jgi:hypothetical protein
MIGLSPADSSRRRREVDAEARMIFGIDVLVPLTEAKIIVKWFAKLWQTKGAFADHGD